MKTAILIPAYNAQDTIAETLRSLMASNLSSCGVERVLLVDDGSTDNTMTIAQEVWQDTVPLELIALQKNIGQYALKHKMVEKLYQENYTWMLILHADDLARADWLSTTVHYMQTHPEVTSICSSWSTFDHTGILDPGENNPNLPAGVVMGSPITVRDTLFRGCWWHISGSAINVTRLGKMPNFNPTLSPFADWHWLLGTLAQGEHILYIPLALILYRQHSNTITTRSFNKGFERVREEMWIFNEFATYCSYPEVARWHTIKGYFALRRVAVASLRRQPTLAWQMARATMTIIINLAHHTKIRAEQSFLQSSQKAE